MCVDTRNYCLSTPCNGNMRVRTFIDLYTGRTCYQYCSCV
jgi:hypothetical protein